MASRSTSDRRRAKLLALLVLIVVAAGVAYAILAVAQEREHQATLDGEKYFALEVQAQGADVASRDVMASVTLVAYGYCEAEQDQRPAARQGLVNAMGNLGSTMPEQDADIVAESAELHLCQHHS